jgi:hypothetical protein
MNRSLRLFSVFFLLAASVHVYGEDPEPIGRMPRHEMMPGLRRRAVVLDIDARVLEQAEQELVVIWNETHSKLAIPGSPVGIKLVGSNLVVAVQFTPFIRRHNQNVLVAQGQIWLDVPNEGIRYYTSIQTIPLEFDEPIYFFPLGQSHQLEASIEIMITVKPYTEAVEPQAEEAADTGDAE